MYANCLPVCVSVCLSLLRLRERSSHRHTDQASTQTNLRKKQLPAGKGFLLDLSVWIYAWSVCLWLLRSQRSYLLHDHSMGVCPVALQCAGYSTPALSQSIADTAEGPSASRARVFARGLSSHSFSTFLKKFRPYYRSVAWYVQVI